VGASLCVHGDSPRLKAHLLSPSTGGTDYPDLDRAILEGALIDGSADVSLSDGFPTDYILVNGCHERPQREALL